RLTAARWRQPPGPRRPPPRRGPAARPPAGETSLKRGRGWTVLISGLLSGIDWEQLVDALIEADRRPVVQIRSRQAQAESLKAAWSEVRNLVTAVRDAVRSLKDRDLLGQ